VTLTFGVINKFVYLTIAMIVDIAAVTVMSGLQEIPHRTLHCP